MCLLRVLAIQSAQHVVRMFGVSPTYGAHTYTLRLLNYDMT